MKNSLLGSLVRSRLDHITCDELVINTLYGHSQHTYDSTRIGGKCKYLSGLSWLNFTAKRVCYFSHGDMTKSLLKWV